MKRLRMKQRLNPRQIRLRAGRRQNKRKAKYSAILQSESQAGEAYWSKIYNELGRHDFLRSLSTDGGNTQDEYTSALMFSSGRQAPLSSPVVVLPISNEGSITQDEYTSALRLAERMQAVADAAALDGCSCGGSQCVTGYRSADQSATQANPGFFRRIGRRIVTALSRG